MIREHGEAKEAAAMLFIMPYKKIPARVIQWQGMRNKTHQNKTIFIITPIREKEKVLLQCVATDRERLQDEMYFTSGKDFYII